jgi:antitoxin component YwqK of YwqJK toxin-antitoxin module
VTKKIKDGPYKKKIKDRLFEEGIIKNGKPNGEFKISYTNGYILEHGIYKNGKRHGLSITNLQFEDSLEKYHELIEYKNGKRNGKYSFFCYDRVEQIGFYKNDKKEGVHKNYYHTHFFIDGPPVLFEETTYKNGKEDGPYYQFQRNGIIQSEGFFRNGKKIGTWERYDHEGNLYSETTYKNGKQHGPYYEYYNNGTIQRYESYKNDKQDGLSGYYNEDGLLQEEENYKNGKIINHKYYTSGKLELEEIYKDGECVDDKEYEDGILQEKRPEEELDDWMSDLVKESEESETIKLKEEEIQSVKDGETIVINVDIIDSKEN